MAPKPRQRPHPPVWLGASSEASVARAARVGTGWIGAGAVSTDDYLRLLPILIEHVEMAGRARADVTTSKRVYIAIGQDREALRTRMRFHLKEIYGRPELADRVALLGGPEECLYELARIRDAGTDMVILHPLFDHDAQVASLVPIMRELKGVG